MFSIVGAPPFITVTFPIAGENWQKGTARTIRWVSFSVKARRRLMKRITFLKKVGSAVFELTPEDY